MKTISKIKMFWNGLSPLLKFAHIWAAVLLSGGIWILAANWSTFGMALTIVILGIAGVVATCACIIALLAHYFPGL